DGIRDWSVTGVQTCALPIYHQIETLVADKVADCEKRECSVCAPLAGQREVVAIDRIRDDLSDRTAGHGVDTYFQRVADCDDRTRVPVDLGCVAAHRGGQPARQDAARMLGDDIRPPQRMRRKHRRMAAPERGMAMN